MIDLTVLRAVALRVAEDEASADDSVPILEAAGEIERLRAQLAKADAIVFLVDANMRGPGAFPIPFGDVKECLDRHRVRMSRIVPNISNNAFGEIQDEGGHSRHENFEARPRSRADDDQVN